MPSVSFHSIGRREQHLLRDIGVREDGSLGPLAVRGVVGGVRCGEDESRLAVRRSGAVAERHETERRKSRVECRRVVVQIWYEEGAAPTRTRRAPVAPREVVPRALSCLRDKEEEIGVRRTHAGHQLHRNRQVL